MTFGPWVKIFVAFLHGFKTATSTLSLLKMSQMQNVNKNKRRVLCTANNVASARQRWVGQTGRQRCSWWELGWMANDAAVDQRRCLGRTTNNGDGWLRAFDDQQRLSCWWLCGKAVVGLAGCDEDEGRERAAVLGFFRNVCGGSGSVT